MRSIVLMPRSLSDRATCREFFHHLFSMYFRENLIAWKTTRVVYLALVNTWGLTLSFTYVVRLSILLLWKYTLLKTSFECITYLHLSKVESPAFCLWHYEIKITSFIFFEQHQQQTECKMYSRAAHSNILGVAEAWQSGCCGPHPSSNPKNN